jgi:lysine 6-dehydrogenase
MSYTYAILGSGMQGTAAAYDLALHGDAESILLGDISLEQAQRNADRVNALVGKNVCTAHEVDALDPEALGKFLDSVDVVLSCVPYWMHPRIAAVAIRHKTSMVDMGGDTAVALETLKLDDQAKAEGVRIVPDTGLAPGLVNDLGNYLMEQFDSTDSVKLYCGGLPQNPRPPFNYKLVFNVEGLVTEYSHSADVIRDGKVIQVDTLAELETIQVDGLGEMEAFTTSGGSSTAPFTHEGKVRNYDYKTIRFPGHCERMRIFKDYGFWSHEPLKTRSGEAIPVEIFHKLMGEALRDPNDKDQVIVRGVGMGVKDGSSKTIQVDIHELHDDKTGFTAMERLTGFSTATYAKHLADQACDPGCHRYETAMTGAKFVDEIQKRGIRLKFIES